MSKVNFILSHSLVSKLSCTNHMFHFITRYKQKLEICDMSATTTCTMFEAEAKKLIKQSASFLIERDDCDIHEQTKQIQKICGQRLIFQFRLNDYNLKYGYQDYTVHRIFFMDPEEDSSVQHVNVEHVSSICTTMLHNILYMCMPYFTMNVYGN